MGRSARLHLPSGQAGVPLQHQLHVLLLVSRREVYPKPAVLTADAEDALCRRLEEHIEAFGLDQFVLVFHGGEPLLFPKRRFAALQDKLNGIEDRTGCRIGRGVSTNGILIDPEWCEIFKTYGVTVSVSLDGPPEINDKHRVDFKGRGTHADTVRGIELLRANGIEPGLISVCNPLTDPERILSYVVEDLGIKQFDILPPDATHSDSPIRSATISSGCSTSGSTDMRPKASGSERWMR